MNNQCCFCGGSDDNNMLYSKVKKVYTHVQCVVNELTKNNPLAIYIAKEFDMIADESCGSGGGCDECEARWCGR